jgi:hypothetical protein
MTRLQNLLRAYKDLSDKYYELLGAVGNKYPDETRHETALKYIKQAENTGAEKIEEVILPGPPMEELISVRTDETTTAKGCEFVIENKGGDRMR